VSRVVCRVLCVACCMVCVVCCNNCMVCCGMTVLCCGVFCCVLLCCFVVQEFVSFLFSLTLSFSVFDCHFRAVAASHITCKPYFVIMNEFIKIEVWKFVDSIFVCGSAERFVCVSFVFHSIFRILFNNIDFMFSQMLDRELSSASTNIV
jgi:hypothetical protein